MSGGPRRATNSYAARYYADPDGYAAGVTIAEYEARKGLPLFTVWPKAEAARKPSDPGRFLYCNATEVERVQLERDRSMPARGCFDCGETLGRASQTDLCPDCQASAKRDVRPLRVGGLVPGSVNASALAPATDARLISSRSTTLEAA